MTRKEEILQAVNNYKNHFPDGFINEYVYVDGAEWADENPNERMIAKYLYEKKGYPIDLEGNLLSFEETMKDVEKKFIDNVCEWLKKLVYQEYPGGPLVRQIDDEQLEELKETVKE